jgi:hypothetical protein
VGLDDALDLKRRTGRLQHHLIGDAEASGEALQLLAARLYAPGRARLLTVFDRDLAEAAVDVQGNRSHIASCSDVRWRRSGQNDTDGFVLSAQPDKSQGRPLSSSGSRPIR